MPATGVPAFLGGDLPPQEQQALEGGHDADLPTLVAQTRADALQNEVLTTSDQDEVHLENAYPASSTTSIHQQQEDLEKSQAQATSEERDSNVVDWDGPNDPANPQNWTSSTKWMQIAIQSLLTLLTPLASSMSAPGVPAVMQDFKSNNDLLATFVVSVYILGFAMGPLVIAPLSEMYGRLPVYHACNIGFVIMTVACALATNLNMLIGFRFLAGCLGVAPITNGGGTIADLMSAEKRGGAMAIWAMGPLLGPVIGPIAGGFLAEAEGWRWIFWVIAIAVGVASMAAIFVLRETYATTILGRKAKRLRKETGNLDLRSKYDLGISTKELWIRSLVRPAKMMFLSPICAMMSLYMAVVYAILYLLFTTFTYVFEDDYGFSASTVGLVYIGAGVGVLLGLAILGVTSDPIMKRLAAKHNEGKLKPEYRLSLLMYAGPSVPVGLFLYGWTAQYHVQYVVPLLGTLFVGIGLIAAFMCINTYLVDTFARYAASALAANTVLRSIFGAVIPLFGLRMYIALGLGWGNSLIAFVALFLCPIPWVFYYHGEKIRTHPKFQIKF
ncbi:Major Facilitator Superfamily [Teratosphaeria destructans]|uniref:Cercosporin MFS transporter CTB4 n=1 Tax=Teratosphaeria destructans TaxID=418781 RepID=A0A9W7SZT3_9PEZI|nr:Major Facilitator Superfamily [Teratosphaeria destructans]